MVKIMTVIIAAILIAGTLATTAAAVEPSSKTGTASITWELEPGGGGGGGDNNRDDRDDRDRRPPLRIDPIRSPQVIVSTPNPQMTLGRLPETGGNHLIPLFLLTAGMSFLLAYTISEKGNRSP